MGGVQSYVSITLLHLKIMSAIKRLCYTTINQTLAFHVPGAGGMNCRTMNLAERESLALNDNLRLILL